ncbi:MAG: c-type cytochrome [Candidatus Tectomicrobia bacterium]|nr:c-type cytochrome [Candidatus Tectomicrobia bacterium]
MTMKQRATALFLVLAGAVLLPTLIATGELGELPKDPLEGRNVFIGKGCARCHAIWGEGARIGPDLGKIGAGRSALELAGVLWNHSPEMLEKMLERKMARPEFTPQEMTSLISFLLYLNYFDEPGDLKAGERLFTEKSCVRCHTVGGRGGSVGPPLDRYQRYLSPLFMIQAMWNHGPQMGKIMQALGVERPVFAGREVADLLTYIRQTAKDSQETRVYMQPGNPDHGKQLFTEKGCINCHSILGEGGKVGPDLGRRPLRRSLIEVAGLMWNHELLMWQKAQELNIPMPTFVDQEMADVIAYLYFIALQGEPGDAIRGRQSFERLRCEACHPVEGVGKKIGPDLVQSKAIRQPIELATAMWNHGPIMAKWVQERNLPWPAVVGNDVADLQIYLLTLQPSSPSQ